MSKTIHVENYKGVREITLHPTGALVVIAGANGAGKSSLIDAITELFDPSGTRLTPKPIHDGADEAKAEYVDTDLDLRITRTWTKNDAGKLTVEALDGARYQRPSEVVAQLTGGLIWDPVTWLAMDEKKQRDALLAKVDLPIDLDAVAREKAGAEARRLEAGREVKRLQGALSTLPKPTPGQATEEVSAADILVSLEAARDVHRNHHGALARADKLRESILIYELKLSEARQHLAATEALIDATTLPDVDALTAQLTSVDAANKAARTAQEYTRVAAELATATGAVNEAQLDLDSIEDRKREALAAATFPVAGLSVDDSGITYLGVPFVQTNSAARRSVAFAIATAGDPKLKLVIIRDGDLLDADSLAMIGDLAEQRGYTVLVERDRDASRSIGFIIEDGVLA